MMVIALAAAYDIALVPLMAAHGNGIALVVVFAVLQFGRHLPPNLGLKAHGRRSSISNNAGPRHYRRYR